MHQYIRREKPLVVNAPVYQKGVKDNYIHMPFYTSLPHSSKFGLDFLI